MSESRLTRQKEALRNLIEEMTQNLPPMLMGIWMVNRSTVCQLLDNLTEDQMNAIVTKAREIVDSIDCPDEVEANGNEHNSDK